MKTKQVTQTLERKAEIAAAAPAPHTPGRLAMLAEQISRRNVAAAHAELLNEALQRLVHLVYEQDASGRWVNIERSGRILIPLPWGRAGHRQWGLRRREGEALRHILFDYQRMHDRRKQVTLFFYAEAERCWYANLADFADEAAGQAWVHQHQVTPAQWRYQVEEREGEERQAAQERSVALG